MVIKEGCGGSPGRCGRGWELGFLCIFVRLFRFCVCKCASNHKPLLLSLSLPGYTSLLAFLAGTMLILFYPTFSLSLSLHFRFNLSLHLKYNNPTSLSVQIIPMNNFMLQAVAHLHTPNSVLLHCLQKDTHSVLDTALSFCQYSTELNNKMFKS